MRDRLDELHRLSAVGAQGRSGCIGHKQRLRSLRRGNFDPNQSGTLSDGDAPYLKGMQRARDELELRLAGAIDTEKPVSIHGGAGGVGTFAVQLAKWRDAHVIGTASAANLPFLRSIGADEVGGDTLERSWPVLRHGGVIVTTAGEISEARAAEYGVRGVLFIVQPSRQQLTTIQELIDRGLIRPVVSAVFPLAQARQAFQRGIAAHTRGKMVLSVLPGQEQAQPSVRAST
jgi:NADPH:quinone reductase-like Zn-dependent oxidoreductase